MSTAVAARPPYTKRAAPPGGLKQFLDLEHGNIQRAMLVQTVRSVVASATVQAADDTISADATGGAITVTLPPAEQLQYLRVTIKRVNSGANVVTVSGTIDGSASFSLASQWKAVTLQSNGVDRWLILSTF